jgi:hypothetical protein
MTPTLFGRIQTRIFIVATIGVIWTLLITPIAALAVPGNPPLSAVYKVTFKALLIVGVVGIAWEGVYHFLQQFRWEKDWPALFGFLTGINEGITTYVWLRIFNFGTVPGGAFLIHFASTWLVLWVWVTGPMRVVFLRWRYRGGRLI